MRLRLASQQGQVGEGLRNEDCVPSREAAGLPVPRSADDLPAGPQDSVCVAVSCASKQGPQQRAPLAGSNDSERACRRRKNWSREDARISENSAKPLSDGISGSAPPLAELVWKRMSSRALVLLPSLRSALRASTRTFLLRLSHGRRPSVD